MKNNNSIKNIFVPTDFSACAGYATDAAMKFAGRFGSTVHLYNCLDLPWNWHTMTAAERAERPEKLQLIENSEILLKKLKEDHSNIEITTVISGGNLLENITNYVKKYGIDIMIMGSHGANGKNECFIGSNTQKAVRLVQHCPVLVVKNKIDNLDFKQVVYASSFNVNERETFLKFKKLMMPFNPVIHLLTVHTSTFFDAPYIVQNAAMEDFIKLVEPLACKKHILSDFSVDSGSRFFAEEIGADLIGISNHYRHPLIRMLVGSNVEALVNHANVPVMTVDY
jgi:nucleotide-binding universal stress UspA family protein